MVTFWSVYLQQWDVCHAAQISDRDLSTLSQRERDRIAIAVKRWDN